MRIGICPVLGRYSGPRTYSLNLTVQMANLDREDEYFLYAENFTHDLGSNFQTSTVKVPAAILHIVPDLPVFLINTRLLRDNIDILFSHRTVLPIIKVRSKFVVTIYDVAWEFHPAWCSPAGYVYLKTFVRDAAKKADAIITISQASKDEIIQVYGVPDDRVHVVYMAAGSEFRSFGERYAIEQLSRYGINQDFILYVGAISERKNTNRLLHAYKILKDECGHSEKLVLVTSHIENPSQFFDQIQRLGLQKEVLVLRNVASSDLPILFSLATAFVYLSLYDGFSLPILEAMSCGTPVVSSRTPAFQEEVQDAALMVNPYKPDEIAHSIHELLSQTSLRSELSRKGLKRAAFFDWKTSAEQTLQILRGL